MIAWTSAFFQCCQQKKQGWVNVFAFWNLKVACHVCVKCKWNYLMFCLASFAFFVGEVCACMFHVFLGSCMLHVFFGELHVIYMFFVGSNSGSSVFCFAPKLPPFWASMAGLRKAFFCLCNLCWQMQWIGMIQSTMLVLCGESTLELAIGSWWIPMVICCMMKTLIGLCGMGGIYHPSLTPRRGPVSWIFRWWGQDTIIR